MMNPKLKLGLVKMSNIFGAFWRGAELCNSTFDRIGTLIIPIPARNRLSIFSQSRTYPEVTDACNSNWAPESR